MQEIGIVESVNEKRGTAKVVFDRKSACDKCRMCLTASGDKMKVYVEVKNTLGAKTGDRVSIELHSGSVFKASLILYGLPLVMLLAGVLLGSFISDLAAALIGIGAAACSFLILRLLEPKFKKMGEFAPRMIAIVGRDEPDEQKKTKEEYQTHSIRRPHSAAAFSIVKTAENEYKASKTVNLCILCEKY